MPESKDPENAVSPASAAGHFNDVAPRASHSAIAIRHSNSVVTFLPDLRLELMRIRPIATLLVSALLLATAAAQDPNALMDAGHFKRARKLVQERYAKNPNDPVALYQMARIKAAFGDNDGAIALAEKSISLDPKIGRAHGLLAEFYGNKANGAGFFEKAGLAHKIKDHLELACQLDPNDSEPQGGLVTFYMEAPGIMGGSESKARDIADRLTKTDPVHGYLVQADIAQRQKKFDQLEGLFQKAVAADPKNYEARISLAGYYGSDRLKQWDKVESNAREAVKLDSSRVGAYALLAIAYVNQERWADLDRVLTDAEKAVPDNLTPMYAAARTLVTLGKDLPRAEGYFRKYLLQEPEGASPQLYGAHWRLGQCLEKEGKKPEAIAEYQAALRLKPDFEPAKKDLKRLQ